ncbi:MAG: hypothetical protein DWQ01_01150 [Planctomycetota bacterium]|nr:MAG: hypothetical protein DWQ01_01150 [Planctomycetota bacterium]
MSLLLLLTGLTPSIQEPPAAPDLVYEDFERADFGNWEVKGTAFGNGPLRRHQIPPRQKGLQPVGEGFAGSHAVREGQDSKTADAATGELLSPRFTIERDYLRFRIAGGDYSQRTCLELLIQGKVVHRATGRRDSLFRVQAFDLRNWQGKNARLRILDAHDGPWGHIQVDHLVFSNTPPESGKGPSSPSRLELQDRINLAIDRGVDFLLRNQNRDGSWSPLGGSPEAHRDQHSGYTSFVLYTLLKCRLPASHPALQRAVTFLEQTYPSHTYSLGSHMMALDALARPEDRKRMEACLTRLMEIQDRQQKDWGYPLHPSLRADFSNTQYAALGLRAARRFGLKVPRSFWLELIETCLRYQHAPRAVDWRGEQGLYATSGQRLIAGFSYTMPDRKGRARGYEGAESASMTAAGVSMLALAQEALGDKMPLEYRKRCQQSIDLGLAWLAEHFTVEKNPGGSPAWVYYYLYGLERIGSLLGVEQIGDFDWYWLGADFLVQSQKPSGEWSTSGRQEWPPKPLILGNTCFALLFLVKASTAVTGEGGPRLARTWAAEGQDSPVWIRAAGSPELSCWVSGFSSSFRSGFGAREPALVEAEYWLDDRLLGKVSADPQLPWDSQRLAMQHRFIANGRFQLRCKLRFRDHQDGGRVHVFESKPVEVVADDILEDWMLAHATAAPKNLLAKAQVRFSASSQAGGRHPPGAVVDGLQFRGWLCDAKDAEPWILLEPKRRIRGQTLKLSLLPGNPYEAAEKARFQRVEVQINRDTPILVEVDLEPNAKTVLRLEKPVSLRRLRIKLLDRKPAQQSAGLAEIEFLKD